MSDYVDSPPIILKMKSGKIIVTLEDGREISNPLEWFPWLANATPKQQANYELLPYSIYWPDLDEGLDIEGMLRGIRPRQISAAPVIQLPVNRSVSKPPTSKVHVRPVDRAAWDVARPSAAKSAPTAAERPAPRAGERSVIKGSDNKPKDNPIPPKAASTPPKDPPTKKNAPKK